MPTDEESVYADKGAPICAIPSAGAFAGLSLKERLYAHHMCRASFHGTRIVLRQTSKESEKIYDLIISLYQAANGSWQELASRMDVSYKDMEYFLDYASMFLANVGNYRVSTLHITKTYSHDISPQATQSSSQKSGLAPCSNSVV